MQGLSVNRLRLCISELETIQRSTRFTPLTALTLFSLAVFSMGGFIFSHSLAIDDDYSLFNTETSWTRALQGRFLIAIIDHLIPQPVTAEFPYLLLAVCYVLSYTLILAIHGLSHNWKTLIGFLIFILFPTNWLSQEFSINAPGFGLSLLFSTSAAYLTSRHNNSSHGNFTRPFSPFGILLLATAISGFQSMVTLYLAIGAGSFLLQDHSQDHKYQKVNKILGVGNLLKSFTPWLITAMAAVALQSLTLAVFLRLTHSHPHQIDIYLRSPYFMLRTQPIAYLSGNFSQLLETYLRPGIFYGHSLWSFTALVIGGSIIGLQASTVFRNSTTTTTLPTSRLDLSSHVIAIVALLAFPLALNAVSTPYRIPTRALMALPYVAWLFSSLWLTITASHNKKSLHLIGVILSSLLFIQCLVATSNYYSARAFNFRSDQLVASTIASALSQYQSETNKVVRYLASEGSLPRKLPYRTGTYSTASASFFNWDGGSTVRMVAWLNAMGITELQAADIKQEKALSSTFALMNPWPAPGSIKVIDQYLLVKFSD